MQPNPPSYTSTYMDILLDSLSRLDTLSADSTATKEDVVHSMRNYHSVLLRKAVATPNNTSFCVYHSPDPVD